MAAAVRKEELSVSDERGEALKFQFADGSRLSGDPQKVGEALQQLRKRLGGTITPEDVINAAEREDSPLHPCFEWDDSEAAHQYRLEQARKVIRAVIVVENGDKTPRRAFIHVEKEAAPYYMDTVDALRNPELRVQVLSRAKAEAESYIRRYGELEELASLVTSMKRAVKRLDKQLVKV